MRTDDLITALVADTDQRRLAPGLALTAAAAVSALVAGTLLMLTMGVRPDFVAALGTIRFDFKFVVTLTVVASAYFLVRESLYPESSARPHFAVLLAGPLLLVAGVIVEMITLPGAAWAMAATGKNAMLCLTVIPALGIIPLGLLIWALRRGAPVRPGLAGIGAGILAGGISATFYAANCTDDSPLFVLTWYPIGVLFLAALGGLLGRQFARW